MSKAFRFGSPINALFAANIDKREIESLSSKFMVGRKLDEISQR